MNRFLRFSLRHSPVVIVLTFLITIFLGFHATKIEMNPDSNSLVPDRSKRIIRLKKTLGVESEQVNYLFLAIESDNLYSMDVLQTYSETIAKIEAFPEIQHALTPFNFVYFDNRGKKVIPTKMVSHGTAPQNEEELNLFKSRCLNNPLAESTVVAAEGSMLISIFTTNYSDDPNVFQQRFDAAIAPLRDKAQVSSSGEILLGSRISYYLEKDFSILLTLAVLTMLAIFFLSFQSKRSLFLPVLVISIGAIWTVGCMSLLHYKLTVISVIVPSLILTIGSSYTIHILNEYFRNASDSSDKQACLADSVSHVIKIVVVAALTTIICFLSLLTTSMSPLREFGLSIALGIFFCALLALFFLPAVFNLMPLPKSHHKKRIKNGLLTKTVTNLGTTAASNPRKTLAFFALLFLITIIVYPHILRQTDYLTYFPDDDPIIIGTKKMISNIGGTQGINITLSAPQDETNYFLDPQVLASVDELESELTGFPEINSLLSFNTILKTMNQAVSGKYAVPEKRGLILLLNRYFRMISADMFSLESNSSVMSEKGNRLTLYMKISNPKSANYLTEDEIRNLHSRLIKLTGKHIEPSINVELWGNAQLQIESATAIQHDQLLSTLLSIILGCVTSYFFFKSIKFSFFVLIPLMSGIFFYYIIMFVFGIPLDMTTILVTNVTVGVGLDDAIHFLLQYKNRRQFEGYSDAILSTLKITGRPIVLTTLSLVAGLLVLCFASFTPIVYFGLLIAGSLFSTMLGTVFFLPAVLSIQERIQALRNTGGPE